MPLMFGDSVQYLCSAFAPEICGSWPCTALTVKSVGKVADVMLTVTGEKPLAVPTLKVLLAAAG